MLSPCSDLLEPEDRGTGQDCLADGGQSFARSGKENREHHSLGFTPVLGTGHVFLTGNIFWGVSILVGCQYEVLILPEGLRLSQGVFQKMETEIFSFGIEISSTAMEMFSSERDGDTQRWDGDVQCWDGDTQHGDGDVQQPSAACLPTPNSSEVTTAL